MQVMQRFSRRVLSRRAYSVAAAHNPLFGSIKDLDPELYQILVNEEHRQKTSLALIPSENCTSIAVLEALGSIMQNKYSEGYPGARYYGGNEFIDQAESLCMKRALEAYRLNPEEWGVNVQPLSGSPANFAAYTALMNPGDRLMGLHLPHGGHLSHGFQVGNKKISATSMYFESLAYQLNESTGTIDYEDMEHMARRYMPKVLIGGGSSYARHWDTARMRTLADEINGTFLFDMAHFSGLVAGEAHPSPFDHAHVVTTTTHKSLRGPRGAMIFYRKGVKSTTKSGKPVMYDFESKVNAAVFPGLQGGPHNHTITALAVALGQAQTPEFKEYQALVVRNMKVLADSLMNRGYTLVSGGTDNHLALVDLRPLKVGGAQSERVLELASIALNKNTVPGDKSALVPGGIRLGTPALTTRGLVEKDMETVAEFIHRGVSIAKDIQKDAGSKKVTDFKSTLESKDRPEIDALRNDVQSFIGQYPLPSLLK